jgi:hypothetical protein
MQSISSTINRILDLVFGDNYKGRAHLQKACHRLFRSKHDEAQTILTELERKRDDRDIGLEAANEYRRTIGQYRTMFEKDFTYS